MVRAVRTELPHARRAVVDGPAHDGMTEAEVPRRFGGADEVGREELVEPDLHGRLRQFGDEGDEPGHERLARDRGGSAARAGASGDSAASSARIAAATAGGGDQPSPGSSIASGCAVPRRGPTA